MYIAEKSTFLSLSERSHVINSVDLAASIHSKSNRLSQFTTNDFESRLFIYVPNPWPCCDLFPCIRYAASLIPSVLHLVTRPALRYVPRSDVCGAFLYSHPLA